MADPKVRPHGHSASVSEMEAAAEARRQRRADPLRDAVERNTNTQGLELIQRDLDKPQLRRPSSDQYMREKGYPNRFDVPKFNKGGMVGPPWAKGGSPKHGQDYSKKGK